MTNLEKVRLKLSDTYQYAEDRQTSDGLRTIYELTHAHIKTDSYSVYVDEVLQTDDTDYEMNTDGGVVIFDIAPAVDLDIRVSYQFSAFSDLDLQEFLDDNGDDVTLAVIDAIDILLIDASRGFDYVTGKAELKKSQVFSNLLRLKDSLIKGSEASNSQAIKFRRTHPLYNSDLTNYTDISRLERDKNGWSC